MRKINKITIIIILLITIFSCTQGYLVNTNNKTNYQEGRNIYLSKCSGCHQLFDPNSYTKGEWNKIMISMQEKSKINDQQKNDIINWIIESQQSIENIEAKK